MKCIIGLGNIGKEYDNTRHNMGFMCLERYTKKLGLNFDKKLKKCIYSDTVINNEKVIFAKPTTFMNLSGEAVVELMNWFKIDLKDICVIYDDIDLPLGSIRYRAKGSSGTHNGMRNILSLVGTDNLSRIRVGIESRENKEQKPLCDFVLNKFTKDELKIFENEIYPKVEESINSFLTN